MPTHSPGHTTNIAIHVVAGSLALLAGVVAIVSPKRAGLHTRAGRVFILLHPGRHDGCHRTAPFRLPVVPRGCDDLEHLRCLCRIPGASAEGQASGDSRSTVERLRFPGSMGIPFSHEALAPALGPVLTWSILGGLILTSGYDLCRVFLPAAWLARTWVQEHLLKMMGAYIAITSAFAGTVFQRYMPWAAIAPSALGVAVEIAFLVAGPRAWKPLSSRKRTA